MEGDFYNNLDDDELLSEVEPVLLIPPPRHRLDWMIKKVAEVKGRLGYSFKELEQ